MKRVGKYPLGSFTAGSDMENDAVINDRQKKLKEIKLLSDETEDKLLLLAGELHWDYKQLLEDTSNMVTCSINPQHRMPVGSLKVHEERCFWHTKGYSSNDKLFPEHSGSGSFITLTSDLLQSITKNVSSSAVFLFLVFLIIMMEFKTNHILLATSTKTYTFVRFLYNKFYSECKPLRAVPESSAKLDQNFDREEKLAIYDYVIANTQKQKSYPDLWLEPAEKSEEKREMAAWELAAAERDAKRRRASYRNKVHTNRKTHTEILREVIEAQMETFKDASKEKPEELSRQQTVNRKSSHESIDKRTHHESSTRHHKEGRNRMRIHDNHSKHREHRRSPSDTGSDTKSRSRFHEKHRKWKTYEGRSHSHRSSHPHRR